MGQSAVTPERLAAATRMLAEAAKRGEIDREPTTPAQTDGPHEVPAEPVGGGDGILQLAITPETLLRLASKDTKELVITINRR